MSDHPRIYLQPECCADPDSGRLWCKDPDPDSCDNGNSWTPYIRADLVEAALPDIAGDEPAPDIRCESEPTEDEKRIYNEIAAQVRDQATDEEQAMLATIAAYTYRLARLQGATHFEALAGVYYSGMTHLQEAGAILESDDEAPH